MTMLGLNILAQTVQDRAALLNWIELAQPAACLVMDSRELAQQIRQRSPATQVIHRVYNPNDARWEQTTTPAAWLDAHLPFAANGVALQVLNEPSPGDLDAFLTFLEGVCSLCPPDVALAFPNFAVGNPRETDILAGKYDRLLRLVCGARHILALHEYFRDAPVSEAPYLCGRYRFWLLRAKTLGLPAPRVVVTEHGRDHGGGRHDGWRDQGWNETDYWTRLVRARELYRQDGIPVCVFGYGRGFNDDWQSFNVEGASDLLRNMATYQEEPPVTQPTIPVPSGSATARKVTGFPPGVVFRNLRTQPDARATDVGDLRVGDLVNVYYDEPQGAWLYVKRPADSAAGWVLWTGVEVEAPAVEPPPTGTATLTPEQFQRWQAVAAEQAAANARMDALIKEVAPALLPGGGF